MRMVHDICMGPFSNSKLNVQIKIEFHWGYTRLGSPLPDIEILQILKYSKMSLFMSYKYVLTLSAYGGSI